MKQGRKRKRKKICDKKGNGKDEVRAKKNSLKVDKKGIFVSICHPIFIEPFPGESFMHLINLLINFSLFCAMRRPLRLNVIEPQGRERLAKEDWWRDS